MLSLFHVQESAVAKHFVALSTNEVSGWYICTLPVGSTPVHSVLEFVHLTCLGTSKKLHTAIFLPVSVWFQDPYSSLLHRYVAIFG